MAPLPSSSHPSTSLPGLLAGAEAGFQAEDDAPGRPAGTEAFLRSITSALGYETSEGRSVALANGLRRARDALALALVELDTRDLGVVRAASGTAVTPGTELQLDPVLAEFAAEAPALRLHAVPTAQARFLKAAGDVLAMALRRPEEGATGVLVIVVKPDRPLARGAEAIAAVGADLLSAELGRGPDQRDVRQRLSERSRRIEQLNRRLRESEERYRLFIEYSVDGIWCLETPLPVPTDIPAEQQRDRWIRFGRVVEANDALAHRLGFDSASTLHGMRIDQLGRHWLTVPSDALSRLATSEYAVQERIVREPAPDGTTRELRVTLFGILSPGSALRLWFVERDVTRERDEERRLRDSEELYKAVIRTAHDGIYLLDDRFHVLDCNESFRQMIGISREELVGKDARSFHAASSPEGMAWLVDEVRARGTWRGRDSFVRADGATIDVSLSMRYSPVGGGRYYCFAADITEQIEARAREREQQAQLAHFSRLSTLGEMASGIAHELNQPLAAIVNYATGSVRMLAQDGSDHELVRQAMTNAADQARRAADIISRMRAFARKGEESRERCSIADLVNETLDLLNANPYRKGAQVDVAFEATEDDVLVDAIQIEQVLANLVGNALESTRADEASTGGRVVVRTLDHHCDRIGRAVEITVEDDGPGIAPEVLAHVFEPFYTTKGQGMGLGLSISESIIRTHGGRLWYSDAPGGGARFHFLLPLRSGRLSE